MEVQLLQSAKLAATGEMAAGVAHELNSPLTAILGNSQLLARELMEKDPRHELAQNIVNSGKRCKSIIQNLLTFARQDNAPRENVSLAECIDQALSLISYQMDRQGIKITKQISGQRQEIFANKQQIEQVLVNLILNARDALEGKEDGGIIIRTGIIDQDDRESVFISVSDNGCGISQQDQESIFQPFYTTKADGKGYGLGLSVSLGIIQNHSGSIEVKSRKNQGSTFKLLLPPARQEV